MTDELVLYTNPMSRGRTARWMLEEVGAPYRAEIIDYATGMKAPDYLRLNPMGKVPALRHGATVVTECAAICAYLADAFPQAGLAPPPGDRLRGPYYRWLFFAAGPIEAMIINRALGVQVPPERERMAGYGRPAHVLDTIEHALTEGPYLTGAQFTAADVYFGATLGWGMAFNLIEKRPALVDYTDRINARPAAVRARAIDDALGAEQATAAAQG
jgi:glutathione S-transferase